MSSVFEQIWQDFEHIVIDGGSTDGSKTYLESHGQNLTYWISEADKGVYHAMNKGINVAKGDYLLFLNSGDHFYSKESLQVFKAFILNKDQKDIIYGNINVISNKEWVKTYPKMLSFAYFVMDTLPHPATLIRRECFADILYDETLKIASDWKFFMLGICRMKYTYRHINATISTFYMDGISSSNSSLVQQERQQVLQNDFYWRYRLYKLHNKLKRVLKIKS